MAEFLPTSNRPTTHGSRRSGSFAADLADLESWIEETPRTATVKGMYMDSFLSIVERCGAPRPTDKRFFTFKDYPLRDCMRMTLDSVCIIYPDISPREGLIRIGRHVYPTLSNTTIGKVLFSVAGRSWERTLNLCRKAWEVSITPGSASLIDLTERSAKVELRSIWNFTDTYQVGVMEGAMESFGVRGTVRPITQGRRCDVDLLLEWEPISQ
ncbi:MAG TPA: DUF2378 family protein [Polyangiaceae bacterium]|nr:DUF2378 family protein [Polyangiaceae bacterium]